MYVDKSPFVFPSQDTNTDEDDKQFVNATINFTPQSSFELTSSQVSSDQLSLSQLSSRGSSQMLNPLLPLSQAPQQQTFQQQQQQPTFQQQQQQPTFQQQQPLQQPPPPSFSWQTNSTLFPNLLYQSANTQVLPAFPFPSEPLAPPIYETLPDYDFDFPSRAANPMFVNPVRPKVCSNCGTSETPTWRRHMVSGMCVCNACGLYYKLHKKDRAFTLNSRGQRVVRRQPRGSTKRAHRRNRDEPTLQFTTSASVPNFEFVPQQQLHQFTPQSPE
ncbi:hypothetical protein H4S02_007296 [Coemansia sp. RSA 2611]|nr:hypothetical protein H4S02_007296 [Coemansia sp. RSA 2611]